jgi:hypothetical protein
VANTVLVTDPLSVIYSVLVALPFAALKSEWLLIAKGEVQLVALMLALGALATAFLTLNLVNDATDAILLPLIFVTPIVTTALAGLVIVFAGRHVDVRALVRPFRREIAMRATVVTLRPDLGTSTPTPTGCSVRPRRCHNGWPV